MRMDYLAGGIILLFSGNGLTGCAGDTRGAFVTMGLATERKKAPDFVEKSRAAERDYAPVGVSAPKRAITAKPKAEVTAAEAEMDAIRNANEEKAREARRAGEKLVQPIAGPPS
jgi:hypothetical protein